jgi:hypothetical protein
MIPPKRSLNGAPVLSERMDELEKPAAEDLFVVASRPLDIGDGEKMCDREPVARGIS